MSPIHRNSHCCMQVRADAHGARGPQEFLARQRAGPTPRPLPCVAPLVPCRVPLVLYVIPLVPCVIPLVPQPLLREPRSSFSRRLIVRSGRRGTRNAQFAVCVPRPIPLHMVRGVPHRVLGVLHRVLGVLGVLHRVLGVQHRVLGVLHWRGQWGDKGTMGPSFGRGVGS